MGPRECVTLSDYRRQVLKLYQADVGFSKGGGVMEAGTISLRKSTADVEIAALEKYARHIRDILRKTTPKDIYASIVDEHRRKLMDMAIWVRKPVLDALLFQRAIPKSAWVRGASWRLEQDYDLVAWVEIEEAAQRLASLAS